MTKNKKSKKGFRNWDNQNTKQRFEDFGHSLLDVVNIGLLFVGGEEIVASEYAIEGMTYLVRSLSTDSKIVDRIGSNIKQFTERKTFLHRTLFKNPNEFHKKLYLSYNQYYWLRPLVKYFPITQFKSMYDFMRYKKSLLDIFKYPFFDKIPSKSMEEYLTFLETLKADNGDIKSLTDFNEFVLQNSALYRIQKLLRSGIDITDIHLAEITAYDESTYELFDKYMQANPSDPGEDFYNDIVTRREIGNRGPNTNKTLFEKKINFYKKNLMDISVEDFRKTSELGRDYVNAPPNTPFTQNNAIKFLNMHNVKFRQ